MVIKKYSIIIGTYYKRIINGVKAPDEIILHQKTPRPNTAKEKKNAKGILGLIKSEGEDKLFSKKMSCNREGNECQDEYKK